MEHHNHGDGLQGGTSSDNGFCNGDGMVMYMDGFHFSLRRGHPCLSLLFPSWKLDSVWKFLCACCFVVAFAFAVEALTKFRQRQRVASPFLHGSQALAGYLLMLVAMTYSVELLASVILGLGIGYRYFFYKVPASHSTANPCCDFLRDRRGDDEAVVDDCCDPLLPQNIIESRGESSSS